MILKGKILGKDIFVNQDNKISSKKFLPRIKSKSLIAEKDKLNFAKLFILIVKKEMVVHLGYFKQKKLSMIKKDR